MKEEVIKILHKYVDFSAYDRGGTTSVIVNTMADEIMELMEKLPDINIEEAEEMAKATDYACFAVESPGNPINFADAASFFLEGWYACCSHIARGGKK